VDHHQHRAFRARHLDLWRRLEPERDAALLRIERELIAHGLEDAGDVGALSRSRLRPRTREPEQLVDDHRDAIEAAADGADRPLRRGVAVQLAREHLQAG
jgi:hypothetical protein